MSTTKNNEQLAQTPASSPNDAPAASPSGQDPAAPDAVGETLVATNASVLEAAGLTSWDDATSAVAAPELLTWEDRTVMQTAAPLEPATAGSAAAPAQEASLRSQPSGVGDAPVDGYLNAVIADRYRILRKVGEGGMGTVYLAEHIIIEKKVALKILSEDFARKADLVQRFMQEARAASKIGHENIVDITDFGETPSGSVFFAMEFLEGRDIAAHIRDDGAMPFERVRYIVNQICRALGAAHSKGIIHRDMKPENVYLIEREGRGDFVKILDFGIAKMSTLDEGSARLTRTGMIFGTPEYMSPEQARGDRPDHRVDIYAVGCILYEMLTGDVPFHAESFMGVLTKHMFEQPEPPTKRAPERHIAADVEAVVMKALAKDRDQRYQTMKEMSVALAACGGLDAQEGWGNESSGVLSVEPSLSGASIRSRNRANATSALAAAAAEAAKPAPETEERPARSPGGMRLVAVGVALVGLTAAVLGYRQLQQPPPVVPTAPVAATTPAPGEPAVAPPPAPTTPPPVAAPVSATIEINSTPAGADVIRGNEVLGQTPVKIELPIADQSVTLMLRKHDFKDHDAVVVPDRNHRYDFDLIPLPKKPGAPRAGVRPDDRSTAPGPRAPANPTSKAAGKLRDLKDPFAQ